MAIVTLLKQLLQGKNIPKVLGTLELLEKGVSSHLDKENHFVF